MLLRRAVLLLVLIAALTAPVAAWAQPAEIAGRQGDNNGTLSILRGRGMVDLQATGAVIGQIRKGKVKVKIYKGKHSGGGHGQVIVRMRGSGTVRHKQEKFRVQINGVGIHLSAVAQGTCALQAAPTAVDPGVFQLNNADYQALPQIQTTYQLSVSTS